MSTKPANRTVLRDASGCVLCCEHPGCTRPAVRVVIQHSPHRRPSAVADIEHVCCSVHSSNMSKQS